MNLELKNNFNYGKGVGKSVVNHYLLRASQLTKKKKCFKKLLLLFCSELFVFLFPKT